MMNTQNIRAEQSIIEEERRLPVVRSIDVLVVGGGMAGCSAAVAAAQSGLQTMLVERYGFLGGTASAAMVGSICGLYTCGPDSSQEQLIYGHAQELIDKLDSKNAGFRRNHRYHFDHAILEMTLDEWLVEVGVNIFFHTQVVDAIVEENTLTGVIIENQAGRSVILARAIIDTSGDGIVAARAGAPYEVGDDMGKLQAPTYVFYVGGVDIERAMAVPDTDLRDMQANFHNSGGNPLPRISGSYTPSNKPGVVHANMTRTSGVNALDPASFSEGHLEGRRQVRIYFGFLKESVPGFENAYIDSIAHELGVRETRRIIGEYILNREDVLEAHKFADAICRSSWPVEDHTIGLDTIRLHLPGDDYYQVPYRALVPLKIDNLLVAGRCMSTTHDALASVRVMGPAIAMGQAAGNAAVIAVQDKLPPRYIPVHKLQTMLRDQGVLI
jgi:hypothetical protein